VSNGLKVAPWLELLVLSTLALSLRLYSFCDHSLWLDESYSLLRSASPWPAFIADIAENDAHPPFYYALLKLWLMVLQGNDPVIAGRMLSAGFDVGTLIFVYLLLCQMASRMAARAGSFCYLSSCWMISLSQEIRHYSLVSLLAIASTWCLVQVLQQNHPRKYIAIYGLLTLVGMYTFYYLAFLFVIHFILFWLLCPKLRAYFLMVIFLMMLLYLPWALWVIPSKVHLLPSTIDSSQVGFGWQNALLLTQHCIWGETAQELHLYLGILLFLALLCPIFQKKWDIPGFLLYIALMVVGSVGLFILLPWKGHVFQTRYLAFLAPLAWIGIMLWACRKMWILALVSFLILLGNFYSLHLYYNQEKQAWQKVATYVSENIQHQDVLCFNPFYLLQPFWYYYENIAPSDREFIPGYSYASSERNLLDERYRHLIYLEPKDLLRTQKYNFWLLEVQNCSVAPPSPNLKQWCALQYKLQKEIRFSGLYGDIVLTQFLRRN